MMLKGVKGTMKFTSSMLNSYALPLSDTENTKCKHAIEEIRDALKDLGYTDDYKDISLLESETLSYSVAMRDKYSKSKIKIFIQGSYANNTCVRNESDVDIAIVREDIYEYAFGENFSTSTEEQKNEAKLLKNNVERVLRKHFPNQVHRCNKSVKVDGNTYRKQADTVPCIAMNYYYKSHLKDYVSSHDGVIIFADDGDIIRNFPKQHIRNGKLKNTQTNHYYKKMVRILKKMRHLMSDCGYSSADNVSSFGLESLLWNVPNSYFTKWTTYGFAFQEIVDYLYNNKGMLYSCYEANGIKKLCPTNNEVSAYSRFIDSLKTFFEYVW